MKSVNFLSLFIAGFLLIFSFSVIKAQDEIPANAANKQTNRESRPNLLAELGLTQNQRQQIHRINAEKKPLMRAAQQRLLDANRSLDQAIYADNVNESEIQSRLKDVQAAHAEVIKIRFTNEVAVRKILTVEQLAKFRALREQFAQMMENNLEQLHKQPLQNLKRDLKLRSNQMRPNN